MTRVVVAERDPVVRSITLAALTATAWVETVVAVTSGSRLAETCRSVDADILLTAPRLDVPVHSHVPALLAAGHRVLLLCDDVGDDMVVAALLAGASGCLSLLDSSPDDVVASVRATRRGEAVLHHDVARAILEQWRLLRRAGRPSHAPASLTPREQEVLAAIADGLTTTAIGRRLGISTKTVEAHKTRIFTKLGARDQAHAITVALGRGMLAHVPAQDTHVAAQTGRRRDPARP